MRSFLLLIASVLLTGCDLGSRSVIPEYFTLHYTWKQLPDGAVVVDGETDLPGGTELDGLLSKSRTAEGAVDGAVLTGSVSDLSSGSKPIKEDVFTLVLRRPLSNSCGFQLPCGPFPGGAYLLLLDAKVPRDPAAGPTTFDDPRYLATTHGLFGFPGIEVSKELSLKPIRRCLDSSGQPGMALGGESGSCRVES